MSICGQNLQVCCCFDSILSSFHLKWSELYWRTVDHLITLSTDGNSSHCWPVFYCWALPYHCALHILEMPCFELYCDNSTKLINVRIILGWWAMFYFRTRFNPGYLTFSVDVNTTSLTWGKCREYLQDFEFGDVEIHKYVRR